jgi:hypothetical protein
MAKKVTPFLDKKTASQEPNPLLPQRSRIVVGVGRNRYAIDLSASVTPLSPVPAPVQVLRRKPIGKKHGLKIESSNSRLRQLASAVPGRRQNSYR